MVEILQVGRRILCRSLNLSKFYVLPLIKNIEISEERDQEQETNLKVGGMIFSIFAGWTETSSISTYLIPYKTNLPKNETST